ncbi:accessory factor UbiK family protein [Halopseudomonas sp.]|uniref:accessory factor UbiK family protein n=1 Tax=Halopseudomonas sp. TaxID=2901191 RepID=UPI0035619B2B
MLHKVLIDAVSNQATRLLMSEKSLPAPEVEKHLKSLLQGALAKLDVVSRDEFETQQVVLLRTRERLEALERRVTEIEQREQQPPTT